MQDSLLIRKCKSGSKDALGQIYAKYRRDLLTLAVALLGDIAAAEDVVHDVFVRFVKTLDDFDLTGSLKGYLITCVANGAKNAARKRSRIAPAPDNTDSSAADCHEPARLAMCNEQLKLLANAMGELPYEQREVISLHLHAGMTFATIAENLEISANTAKSRYRYAIDKLRLTLNSEANKNDTCRQNKNAV